MNREAVQTEIQNLISAFQKRTHYARQYAPAKHQIQTLTDLGILDLMPAKFGHGDAKIIIEAAQDAGGKRGAMNAYGEGETWTEEASTLYQLLNEVEDDSEETEDELDQFERIQISDAMPQQSTSEASRSAGHTDGDELVIWYNKTQSEWQAAFSGVSSGNLYEGDTLTGFNSKQEAIDYAMWTIEEGKRTDDMQDMLDEIRRSEN